MPVLGIVLQKNFMRFSVLDGDRDGPIFIDKGRIATCDPKDVPQLMDWYETSFQQIIAEYHPSIIAYKLSLDPNIEQLHNLSFPLGVLNLLARKRGIQVKEFSHRAITPNKLGLHKSVDLQKYVDDTFGERPPYWDKYQKYHGK